MARKDREARARAVSERDAQSTASESSARTVAFGSRGAAAAVSPALQTGTRVLLEWLLRRDDGWLRVVRKRDTDTVYWKWKFTAGRRHNSYIMSVAENWQVDYALQLLVMKLTKYDEGDDSDLVNDTYHDGIVEEVRSGRV